LAAARALESELYGVDPGDPWTLGAVAGVLVAVALGAALPAAARASRSEPARVLRQE
jgi:ABC-type lipoprotein release transport system permease subunit